MNRNEFNKLIISLVTTSAIIGISNDDVQQQIEKTHYRFVCDPETYAMVSQYVPNVSDVSDTSFLITYPNFDINVVQSLLLPKNECVLVNLLDIKEHNDIDKINWDMLNLIRNGTHGV